MLENHLDGAHPAWVHASSVAVARSAPEPGKPGEEHYYDIAVRQMRQNGAPDAVWEAVGIWTTPHGHGYMGDYHDDSRLVAGMGNPVFEDYRRRLAARVGEKEADRILRVTLWNTIVYPNASFMSQFRQLRIVHPLAVDRSVVYTYSFRMKDAPAQMFRDTIAFANVVNGTASGVDRRPEARAHPERVLFGRGGMGLHRTRPRPRCERAQRSGTRRHWH